MSLREAPADPRVAKEVNTAVFMKQPFYWATRFEQMEELALFVLME
jgi:hypothetical protein